MCLRLMQLCLRLVLQKTQLHKTQQNHLETKTQGIYILCQKSLWSVEEFIQEKTICKTDVCHMFKTRKRDSMSLYRFPLLTII